MKMASVQKPLLHIITVELKTKKTPQKKLYDVIKLYQYKMDNILKHKCENTNFHKCENFFKCEA